MPEDFFSYLNNYTVVSRETFDRLSQYRELLLKWQPKINLIGPDTINDIWKRHFLDSLQLQKLIPDHSLACVDFGSGAGFPGIVLAISGMTNMHLIESDAKKISFLREVARITNTAINIHHCRIEDHPIAKSDIIISRACSSLNSLLEFSLPYVSHETICLFLKGKNYFQDVLDANEHWLFDYTVIASVTDNQGVILKITNLRKKAIRTI